MFLTVVDESNASRFLLAYHAISNILTV